MSICALLREDIGCGGLKLLKKILLRPGHFAVFMYRLSSETYRGGALGKFFANIIFRLNIFITGCEISPAAQIGPGLNIVHPIGIVIAPAVIGRNFTIYQNVTIGQRKHGVIVSQWATIGDDVVAYAGAVIIGQINIGNRVSIGANAVVHMDVAVGSTVVPAPVRIIGPLEEQENAG